MVAPAFSKERLERMRDSWTPADVRALVDDYLALVHVEPSDEHEQRAQHIYSRSPRVPGSDAALGEAIRLVCGHVPTLKQEKPGAPIYASLPPPCNWCALGDTVERALRELLAAVTTYKILDPEPPPAPQGDDDFDARADAALTATMARARRVARATSKK